MQLITMNAINAIANDYTFDIKCYLKLYNYTVVVV